MKDLTITTGSSGQYFVMTS